MDVEGQLRGGAHGPHETGPIVMLGDEAAVMTVDVDGVAPAASTA